MRTEHLITYRQYLEDLAARISYVLTTKTEEGDSYSFVYMCPMDQGKPELSLDYSSREGKLRFVTQLPMDRWGYAQRGYTSNLPSTHECSINPDKNTVSRAATHVGKMILESMPVHAKHVEMVKGVESYYDRQMENATQFVEQLKCAGVKNFPMGIGERPNHNGVVMVTVRYGDGYDTAEITGNGVRIDTGNITPGLAAGIAAMIVNSTNSNPS